MPLDGFHLEGADRSDDSLSRPAYQVLSGTRVVIQHGTTYRPLRLGSRAAFDPRDLRQPSGAVARDALAVGLENDPVARLAPP